MYAVGVDNTILHFDGSLWRRLAVPVTGDSRFTAVHPLPSGEVLVSGMDGDHGICPSFIEYEPAAESPWRRLKH